MDSAAEKFLMSVGLCLILATMEIPFPAQPKQTLRGRARNLLLTAITLGLGAAGIRLV